MSYTDDEVRAAIATTEECKVYSNANRMTRGELDAISWASSEYLKAKTVIEWYAIPNIKHGTENPNRTSCAACDARVAREYLVSLKKT